MRDLLSTYGFRGGVEPMVGLAVQRRGFGGPSPLTIVLTVSLADSCCRRARSCAHLSNPVVCRAEPYQSVVPADAATPGHFYT